MMNQQITPLHSFTEGIEGPAVDRWGNLYAVNYAREGSIGRITPTGTASVFVDLPNGSIGNGIRFNRAGDMLIADYANHSILRVDMQTRAVTIHAHEPRMNQPNDIAISADDIVFASDPNWADDTGQMWRIGTDGSRTCLETDMGTTNGIEVSFDEQTLYVNESVQRRIWAYDLVENTPIRKRLFIEFPDFGLDGMRCDIVGNLYVTRYGKGTIAKLSPTGDLISEIPLSGTRPTNLTFGGADGCTCYVTLADHGNIEAFRTELPGRQWQLHQRD